MKIIKLNVGGIHYQTTYDTLVLEPLSKLSLIVHHAERLDISDASNGEQKATENGIETEEKTAEKKEEEKAEESKKEDDIPEIFIDRNGNLFEFVLEYLRNPNSVRLPSDSHLLLKRLRDEAEYFKLEGLKKEVDFALLTFPYAIGDTVRLRPDVVGRWINNVVDKNNPTQFLYACGLEHVEELPSSWSALNPFRKKTLEETFWSLFSRKRSPAEVYAWRGKVTDFVERPNPDYAVVRFRLPQYSKKKEDPEYVDLDLRVQLGMMVKVK